MLVGPITCARLPRISPMFLRHICYLRFGLLKDVQDHLTTTNGSARIAVVEQSDHVISCLITSSFNVSIMVTIWRLSVLPTPPFINSSFFLVTWLRVELLLRHWKEFQKPCSAYFPYLVYLWKYFCLTFCPSKLTLNSGGSNPSSTTHITVNPLKLHENTFWFQDGKKHNSLELWIKSMGMFKSVYKHATGQYWIIHYLSTLTSRVVLQK